MRTGRNIMSEIAAKPEETRHSLNAKYYSKLCGGGRKRKKAPSHSHKAKRVKIAKRKSSKRKAPATTMKEIFS
jgi:hypothetical protein